MTDWEIVLSEWPRFASGFGTTLALFLLSTIGAFLIGMIFVNILYGRNRIARKAVGIYIDGMRMLPFLIFVYLLYYGLPSVGISMAPSSVSSVRSVTGEESRSSDVSVSQTEVSAVTGVELSYALSGGRALLLDLRYACGLTNVVPEDETVAPDASIHSRTLSLSLGYVFGD